MTLIELRKRLARETGLAADNELQAGTLDDLINDAAQQIYTQTDLPRALREEAFSVDTTDRVPRITLPERVGEIRGVRDWADRIKLHDIRPKYNTLPWPNDVLYTFRILYETPIARSIDNALGLYMVPLAVDPNSVTVSVVGSTADAQEVHATFAGDGTGSAVGVLWTSIASITKDAITPVDVILLSGDASGEEMARLTSYGSRSKYIEIELYEYGGRACSCSEPTWSVDRCLEVLYKPPFRPLYEDNSTFQLDGYDYEILYTAVKIYRIRGLGAEATDAQIAAAKVHAVRADELLAQRINDKIQGEELVIAYGPARWDMRRLRGLRQARYGRYTWQGGPFQS